MGEELVTQAEQPSHPRECLPAAGSEYAGRPGDPSSACAPASPGSPPHPPSTTRSSVLPAAVRTSARVHWLPCPRALWLCVPLDPGRIFPLPPGAAVAALAVPRFLYRRMQFVESPDGNHTLQYSLLAPFSRALVG